jgi:hypothetical protein
MILVVAVITVAATGCAAIECGSCQNAPTPSQAACAGVGTLTFGTQGTVPVCDVAMSYGLLGGRLFLDVMAELPASELYGSRDGPARLHIMSCTAVGAYHCPAAQGGLATIGPESRRGGLFVGTGTGNMGSCRLANDADRTAVECEFDDGPDTLRMTGDLPPAPDPRSDPSLAWFEATYTFKGDYQADELVEFVGAMPGLFLIPLADGGLLTVVPGGNDDGKVAWLSLPATGDPADQWLPDKQTPSLGTCVATIGDGARRGTLVCPGDPASASGSSTLELTWRLVP